MWYSCISACIIPILELCPVLSWRPFIVIYSKNIHSKLLKIDLLNTACIFASSVLFFAGYVNFCCLHSLCWSSMSSLIFYISPMKCFSAS